MADRVALGKIVRRTGIALLLTGGPLFLVTWLHMVGAIACFACLVGLALYFAGSAIAGRNLASPWQPVKRRPPRWPAPTGPAGGGET